MGDVQSGTRTWGCRGSVLGKELTDHIPRGKTERVKQISEEECPEMFTTAIIFVITCWLLHYIQNSPIVLRSR